jgi:DNA-binding LacI/PurR family transcriptional regulator
MSSSDATMQDIAEKLDLSVATVSRALRRVPGINAETRSRVIRAASELGYRISDSYRSSQLNKDGLRHIGVLIETTHTNLPAGYLTGLSDASMALNASLIIHYVKPGECESILNPKLQPRAMQTGLLSGLVMIFWWPTEVVHELSKKLPTVSIIHKYPGVDIDVIGLDNQGGMETLVRHLHSQGHRKIGFFGRCGQLHWAIARFGGYVAVLTALGIEYRPDWVVDVDLDSLADSYHALDEYFPKIEKLIRAGVTAFVCVSESAAWQLHTWLTSHGFRVPEDVSITGFHRPDIMPKDVPDLTSVGASYEAMGSAALKRLLFRVQNPAETSRMILFPAELHTGQTVAAPRNSLVPQLTAP